jgi:hypothetical protein
MYLPIPTAFLLAEKNAWMTGDKCLCIRGFIEYRDVFQNTRMTRCCYAYQTFVEGGAFQNAITGKQFMSPEFRKAGPEVYNEIT